MFTIPLIVFLLLYLVFLLTFLVFAVINVMHFVRAGAVNKTSITVFVIFFIFSALVLFGTWQLLQGTNWQQGLTIGSNPFSGGSLLNNEPTF